METGTFDAGDYVDTVEKYETVIKEHIRNRLQDDMANDRFGMKEIVDPFTSEKNKQV